MKGRIPGRCSLALAGWLLLLGPLLLDAQVDNSFRCVLGGENGEVHALLKLPDGQTLIGGSFTSVQGVPRYGVGRLQANGQVDTAFDAGVVLGAVRALALQADGKILIGGSFNSVNGIARYGVARLNADGSTDAEFNSAAAVMLSAVSGTVQALAVQADGAIVLGGIFDRVNGVARSRIARLLPNGQLDTRFNPGAGIGGGNLRVNAIALQPDGRILVGGAFARYDNINRRNLVRLNPDGALDTSFDPLDQLYGEIFSLIAHPDGRIVVAGLKYCRRLMPDGKSLDPTFIEPDTGIGADGAELRVAVPLPGGGYLIGGKFYRIGNRYRLNAAAFGRNTYVAVGEAVFYAGDDYPNRADLLTFTNQAGLRLPPLTGLAFGHETFVGTGLDATIFISSGLGQWTAVQTDAPLGFNQVVFGNNRFLAVGPGGTIRLSDDDGKTWLTPAVSPTSAALYGAAGAGGRWVAVGGTPGQGIALHSDDGMNWAASTDAGTNILFGVVHGKGLFVAAGENGAILTSADGRDWSRASDGYTNSIHGLAFGNDTFVAVGDAGRILSSPDGVSWANVFNYSPQTPLAPLHGITFANGKFLTVGGGGTVLLSDPGLAPPSFYFLDRTLADQYQNCAALLESNGVVRTEFVSGISDLLSVYPETVNAAVPDGTGVLVAGNFVQVNATNAGDVARLKWDGSIDETFDIGMGIGGETTPGAIAVQPDGRILIGGDFTSVNGVRRHRIARVHPDGSLDQSFDPGTGADRRVNAVAVEASGKIVIAGMFTGVNQRGRRPVARLNADGSVDTTFDPGIGLAFNDSITALAVQPDGKVLLNGSAARILRLNASGTTDTAFMDTLGVGIARGSVHAIALQPDGRILLGGTFTNVSGRAAYGLARLLPSGALDELFLDAIETGANGSVDSVALRTGTALPEFAILIGGSFTGFNGVPSGRLARLDGDGTLDAAFSAYATAPTNISLIVPDPVEPRLYVAGPFTNFYALDRSRLARLHADGQLDPAFNSGSGPDAILSALAVQSDQRILVGGAFRTWDGARWPNLVRLLPAAAERGLALWRTAHFSAIELADPAISGDGADPDGDSLVNLIEYALNLDPREARRRDLPSVAVEPNPVDGQKYAVLIYHRRIGSPEVLYLLEASDNLAAWDASGYWFETLSVVSDSNGVTETVRVRIKPAVPGTAQRFVRLRIRPTP